MKINSRIIKWTTLIVLICLFFLVVYSIYLALHNRQEKICRDKIEYVNRDWMGEDYYSNCSYRFILGYNDAEKFKHYSKDEIIPGWLPFGQNEIERITFADKPENATVVIRVFSKTTDSVDKWLSLYKNTLTNTPGVSNIENINDSRIGIKDLRQVSYKTGNKTFIANLIVTPKSNLVMELLKNDDSAGTQVWDSNSYIVHSFYQMQ